MKKILYILLLLAVTGVYAQRNTTLIRLGAFSPGATETGFIIGYQGGRYIDEHFDIGYSIDWFHKSYTDQRLVKEFNNSFPIQGELNELRAKTSLHQFPVLFNVVGSWPITPQLDAYISGGIGAELILVDYTKFDNVQESELKGAVDWSWRVSAGIIYPLGSRSDALIEVGYHSSEPSWEYEVGTNPKKVFVRSYDMSGFLVRGGVRFYY